MRTVAALGVLFISGLALAEAKECRLTDKQVVHSTVSETQNKDDGGHVSLHVVGYATEKDNTQFMTWTDFTTAFAGLQKAKIKNAASCSGSSGVRMDCIDAKTAGITSAQQCNATDSKQGCATNPQPTSFKPKNVVFRYLNDASTKNEWVVHTAYPTKKATCPKS